MAIPTQEISNGGEARETASPEPAWAKPRERAEGESWDNEGGALAPASSAACEPERTPVRKSEDTVDGCRAMASADRARADAVSSDQMRSRLEHSAQAWASRADMFEGIERRLADRRNADRDAGAADDVPGTETDNG